MESLEQFSADLQHSIQEFLTDGLVTADQNEISELLDRYRRVVISIPVIYLSDHSGTMASGAAATQSAIENWARDSGHNIELIKTGGFGFFNAEPVVGIQLPGRNRLFFGPVADFQVSGLMNAVFRQYVPRELLLGQWPAEEHLEWESIPYLSEHPFFKGQERRVLHLHGILNPESILEYISWGGYHAFAKSLKYAAHHEIMDALKEAGLRGRSGSGFPAYRKWTEALSVPANKRYVICNADESDPGAFMHRVLMEGNPHLLLEGLLLTAYAIGSKEVIIYTRSRYAKAVERLELAVKQARQLGLFGQDIFQSGFSVEIQIRKGPGAYICGEETALIASIEGKRGMPRIKPPYPSENGLFGKPTLVHNVETLAQIPLLVENGPHWYKRLGTAGSSGTKLFSLSGKFSNTGVVEVPFGTTLGSILWVNAQGVKNAKEVKAILPGGPSGKYILPDKFSLPLDYDVFKANGLVLGSGSLVLLDENSCPIDLAGHLMKFVQLESCGKCIPCREGTRRLAEIIGNVTHRPGFEGKHQDLLRFKGLTELEPLARIIRETSLCGLGKTAGNPVLSALECFREEIEEHVFNRVCPSGVCQDLRTFYINPEICTGCYVCFPKCPEQAIIGSPRQAHAIVSERCTGCGKCQEVCKFNAVLVH